MIGKCRGMDKTLKTKRAHVSYSAPTHVWQILKVLDDNRNRDARNGYHPRCPWERVRRNAHRTVWFNTFHAYMLTTCKVPLR